MRSGAFIEKRELASLTSISYNGIANQAAEMEMGNKMAVALNNLGNATTQKKLHH